MASCSADGSKEHHRFTLNVWESNRDSDNNSSTVTWEFYLSSIQTGWDWAHSGVSYSVTVDGTTSTGSIYRYDGSSNTKITSGSKSITHNDDGSKTISFKFKITDTSGQSYTSGNAEANGTLTLTKFNRQAIVTNATDFTDETNPTITFNKSGGYRINARLEFAGTFIQRDNISNTGTYTFDLTAEERELLRSKTPNSNSMTVREVIGTCINSSSETHWSWKDKTMTIVNGNPIFNDFTYQDINADVVAITGDNQAIIKGQSNLQVIIPTVDKMQTQKYSTPVKYVSTIDTLTNSANYSDENNVIINLNQTKNGGTKRLSVRAYDSRNNSTEAFKDIVVYDYSRPKINVNAERVNNFENETIIKINGTYSPLIINNVSKNTITQISYRYREKGGTWGAWTVQSFTASDGSFNVSDIHVSLDNEKGFEIQAMVIDELTFWIAETSVDVGMPIFMISSNLKQCYVGEKRVLTEGDFNNIYSVNEELTGEFWIDGKPIYRKVIEFNSITNTSGDNYVDTNITNLDKCIGLDGMFYLNNSTNNFAIPICFHNSVTGSGAYSFCCFYNYTNNKIVILCKTVINSGYVVIKYTKTTN